MYKTDYELVNVTMLIHPTGRIFDNEVASVLDTYPAIDYNNSRELPDNRVELTRDVVELEFIAFAPSFGYDRGGIDYEINAVGFSDVFMEHYPLIVDVGMELLRKCIREPSNVVNFIMVWKYGSTTGSFIDDCDYYFEPVGLLDFANLGILPLFTEMENK